MPTNLWFISDTHFFHRNMVEKFTEADGTRVRPEFSSVEECDTAMAERWNAVVKPGDKVYHLGDVSFKDGEKLLTLVTSLNGRKRLVLGNHDKLTTGSALLRCFEKVTLWRGWKEHGFTCTHIPMLLDKIRWGGVNVHGHTHRALMADPRYINVCVERRNYTPVHLDEILAEISLIGGEGCPPFI